MNDNDFTNRLLADIVIYGNDIAKLRASNINNRTLATRFYLDTRPKNIPDDRNYRVYKAAISIYFADLNEFFNAGDIFIMTQLEDDRYCITRPVDE